jgi:hypothetical protein
MMGKKIYDFGDDPEAANAVKLAGNFLILSVIEMLGEAFAFVQKAKDQIRLRTIFGRCCLLHNISELSLTDFR